MNFQTCVHRVENLVTGQETVIWAFLVVLLIVAVRGWAARLVVRGGVRLEVAAAGRCAAPANAPVRPRRR
jgi:hypothetical protein